LQDVDIEQILSKGEEKTNELNQKLKKHTQHLLDALDGTRSNTLTHRRPFTLIVA
jgi:hypothetical protein